MGRTSPTIIAGTHYGHLVTTGKYIRGRNSIGEGYIEATLECICDCGNVTYKKLGSLKNKGTKSCSKKCPYFVNVKHGFSRKENNKQPKEYMAWRSMIYVCDNPRHYGYAKTGKMGITYHESLKTIEGFLKIMGRAPSKYHRFSRIDKSGDFEPGNIHWYLASEKKKT